MALLWNKSILLNFWQGKALFPRKGCASYISSKHNPDNVVLSQWLINTLTEHRAPLSENKGTATVASPSCHILQTAPRYSLAGRLKGTGWNRQVCTFAHVALGCLLPWWPPEYPHTAQCDIFNKVSGLWLYCLVRLWRCEVKMSTFLFFLFLSVAET